MKKSLKEDMRGVAHIVAIALVVIVIGAAGFAAWRVMNKDKASDANNQISQQAAKECNKNIDDKDLCKFLSNWEQSKQYRVVTTSTEGGQKSTSTFEIDGEKTHVVIAGPSAYETITIGDTTYTKAGDTWWKQTAKPQQEAAPATDDLKVDFKEPSTDDSAKNQPTYKNLGKEACGDLQCFKYQVVDPSNASSTEYIWFDDGDYKLRRTLSESKDGGASDSTFEYDGVSISEPTPVKELAPNQYIMPGQSEPATLPTY